MRSCLLFSKGKKKNVRVHFLKPPSVILNRSAAQGSVKMFMEVTVMRSHYRKHSFEIEILGLRDRELMVDA